MSRLPLQRSWRRAALAVLAPACAVLFAEVALRIAGFSAPTADPYASFVLHEPLFVRAGDSWTTSPDRTAFFHATRFPVQRPEGGVRAFFLGGSVVYGYPLRDPLRANCCERMRETLAAGRPGRSVEVINCGGICYASYRLVGIAGECLDHQPDLLVLMSGHNEFLEPRHYRELLRKGWREQFVARSRLAQALVWLRERAAARRYLPPVRPRSVRTVLPANGIDERYMVRDDYERNQALEHYRHNLARIADLCAARKVPLILVTLPSNLRDAAPFVTLPSPDLPAGEMAALAGRVQDLIAKGSIPEALMVAEDVVGANPRAAAFHYAAAVCLDRLGKYDRALARYRLARDWDGFPHRAPSSFNDAVRHIAETRGLALVDGERLFERVAADGIPGADLFLDHCHPNERGHELLGRAIAEKAEALLTAAPRQPSARPSAGRL